MTEYITKEHAIDEVWDAFMSWDDPDLGRVIEENIERFPAADVAPVIHGKWLNGKTFLENAVCSNCKTTYEAYYSKYQYCPHCGAKMDGENKEMKIMVRENEDDPWVE